LLEAFQNRFGQPTVDFEVEELDPTDPDTDGDGYWDGWIGVYDVGRTDNVILYREHLEGGITADGPVNETVPQQTGTHDAGEAPSAIVADIDPDAAGDHSNIHIGELRWDTDPTEGVEQDLDPDSIGNDVPDTQLDIEVDWVEGHNPYSLTENGRALIETAERTLRIYGIDVEFHSDSESTLSTDQLQDVITGGGIGSGGVDYVTPRQMNAQELNVIESQYHDNLNRMHLLFATEYGPDSQSYFPHDQFIDPGPNEEILGLEGHTGSPGQVSALEETGRVPYGAVVMDTATLTHDATLQTLLHEVGHGLSIGWLDDKGPGHVDECYSGSRCVGRSIAGIDVGGGTDETPEEVGVGRTDWSIMTDGTTMEDFGNNRFAFSIEEISTVDIEDVPSRND